jgi:putative ABC transport system ATP-binding protein
LLRTDSLSRIVRSKHLVENVTVDIQEGSVVAVFGPSGSGKSSFLRLLNRLDEPTQGTVLIRGVDYRTIPPRDLRRRVGMAMQSPHLFPGTVADNIRFGPRQRGEELSLEHIEQLLERVNLAGYAGRDINPLSGGESQRVSLARTLANSPEVLLLDEPTSALDASTRDDVEELICSIIRGGELTCLIVTHDTDQARRMATEAMVMDAGRLVAFGPVEEVLDA